MGQGIAAVLAAAGHEVTVVDTADRLPGSLARIASRQPAPPSPVSGTPELADAVASAALVIEAVPEDLGLKLGVLAAISAATGPDAIIATNTSSLPLDRLATAVVHPERFLAAHFFHPAETIPGVEVARAEQTGQHAVDEVLRVLSAAGKEPIEVAACVGFVANRLQLALFQEALACVEEGVITPADLDAVVRRTMGVRLPAYGPFAVADMAGLDVYRSILTVLHEQYGDRFAVPERITAMVEAGRLGAKAGAGFFEYADADQLAVRRDAVYRRILGAVT
ncbi:3-hydroxyacyl-CoA dehydrogenase family protein [Kribbella sandramycini]